MGRIIDSILSGGVFLTATLLTYKYLKDRKRKLIIEGQCEAKNKFNIDLNKIIEKMKNKNIINIDDINDEELLVILFTAKTFEKILRDKKDSKYLKDKVFCSLFTEPSTRTRCSFDSAILRLGSKVINITDVNSTSFYKGETVQDTFSVMSKYVDGIIYRDASNVIQKIYCA